MSEFIYVIAIAFLLSSLYHTNEALEDNRHKTDGWFFLVLRATIMGLLASTIAFVCYFALKDLNISFKIFEHNVAVKDGVLIFISTFIPFFYREIISTTKKVIAKKGD